MARLRRVVRGLLLTLALLGAIGVGLALLGILAPAFLASPSRVAMSLAVVTLCVALMVAAIRAMVRAGSRAVRDAFLTLAYLFVLLVGLISLGGVGPGFDDSPWHGAAALAFSLSLTAAAIWALARAWKRSRSGRAVANPPEGPLAGLGTDARTFRPASGRWLRPALTMFIPAQLVLVWLSIYYDTPLPMAVAALLLGVVVLIGLGDRGTRLAMGRRSMAFRAPLVRPQSVDYGDIVRVRTTHESSFSDLLLHRGLLEWVLRRQGDAPTPRVGHLELLRPGKDNINIPLLAFRPEDASEIVRRLRDAGVPGLPPAEPAMPALDALRRVPDPTVQGNELAAAILAGASLAVLGGAAWGLLSFLPGLELSLLAAALGFAVAWPARTILQRTRTGGVVAVAAGLATVAWGKVLALAVRPPDGDGPLAWPPDLSAIADGAPALLSVWDPLFLAAAAYAAWQVAGPRRDRRPRPTA